jgi:TniQ
MHSRLPIAVAPAHHETAASYVTRLANLHGIAFPELWQQVSRPRTATSPARFVAADRLAAVTGIPEDRLTRALIEIRRPEPDWLAFRHEPQHGCPRCTARHPGGPVRQLLPHHRYVCTRHRIWIGPPDVINLPCPAFDELPEIVAAQRAHLRLLHRLGPAATYDAVLTGFLICGHRWDQDAHHPEDARITWDERAADLIPHGTEDTTFSTSRLFAATYPEAVKIAALVGSLHWRRLAASDPAGQHRFATEIGRRLGHLDYRPKVLKDPVAHWIDDDCWRPPSLPRTTTTPSAASVAKRSPRSTSTASTGTDAAPAGSPTTAAADGPSSITDTSDPSSPVTGQSAWTCSSAPSTPAPRRPHSLNPAPLPPPRTTTPNSSSPTTSDPPLRNPPISTPPPTPHPGPPATHRQDHEEDDRYSDANASSLPHRDADPGHNEPPPTISTRGGWHFLDRATSRGRRRAFGIRGGARSGVAHDGLAAPASSSLAGVERLNRALNSPTKVSTVEANRSRLVTDA